MFDNLKKAISFTAFAFLFIFVRFNLTINGATVDIMPDFIGWLLLFLAFDRLGDYGRGKEYLKWSAFVMMIATVVQFAFDVGRPDQTHQILDTVINIQQAIYIFLYLGIIEVVAEDVGSTRSDRIHTLRIVTLALDVFLILIGLFAARIDVPTVITVLAAGTASLIVLIMLLLALFKLRKEVRALL